MVTITKEYIEQKMQHMQACKKGVRQFEYRQAAFEHALKDRYRQLSQSQTATKDYIADSLNVLHSVLNQPDLVDQTLLVEYISEIIRFVENVGLGFEFGKAFIDRSIDVYRSANYPLVELYLTKARFLRLEKLENQERERAFQAACADARQRHNLESLIKALLQLAEYYTEVSLYENALRTCHECERIIQDKSLEGRGQFYLPRVLTDFGMNYTTMLQYKQARRYFLQAKEVLEGNLALLREAQTSYPGKRTLSTVLHYLGRIAEAQGYFGEAMYYYVESERYQLMCPEELSATAFQHLRFGELLTSTGLVREARDHIRLSQELFNHIQFSSSGSVLVGLAWASISQQEGDYKRARLYLLRAREDARARNFVRGELLCLVKLFWLELHHFQVHHAFSIFYQGMMTWRNGELHRSGGLRLFRKYLTQVLAAPFRHLLRFAHGISGGAIRSTSLTSCTCSIHRASATVND